MESDQEIRHDLVLWTMYNANHKRHLLISSRYCTLTSLDVLRTRPEDSLLTDLVVRSPGMVPITPNFRQLGGKRIVLFKHIHGRLAWELCAADVLKAARQLWYWMVYCIGGLHPCTVMDIGNAELGCGIDLSTHRCGRTWEKLIG